jgi:xanthine dehydrogenase accessory factor
MWDWVTELHHYRKLGRPIALVTVVRCTGSTPREPGAKMLVFENGRILGTIGGGQLELLAIDDAKQCINLGYNKMESYPLGAKTGQCCGGIVDLWIETFSVGHKLYLFGAGHVGQAVCQVLSGTPFELHLIDPREEWIGSEKIPSDVIRHQCDWDDFVKTVHWNEKAYAAVMTHDHSIDQAIVEFLLSSQACFIGLIGSQPKWKRFQKRLKAKGVSEDDLFRVTCPIGIPIGGKAPKEVAISIAAQLLSIYYEQDRPISAPSISCRKFDEDGHSKRISPLPEPALANMAD